MLYDLPENTLQWLLITVAAIPLLIRTIVVHRRNPSRISYAMGWIFLCAMLGSGLITVAFATTRDFVLLSLLFTVGDFFFHLLYIWVLRVLWLLTLQKRVVFMYILLPFLVLVISSFTVAVLAYSPDGIQVQDGLLVYTQTDFLYDLLFSLSSLPILGIGLVLLAQVKKTKSSRGRVRSVTLGVMFTMIGAVYALSAFTEELSSESFVLIGIAGSIAMLGTLLAPFLSSSNKK